MSEDKKSRRRFLADLLFAGGALSAAALAAKASLGPSNSPEASVSPHTIAATPEPLQTPVVKPPEPPLPGAMINPSPTFEPALGGKTAPPQPEAMVEGGMRMPDPHPQPNTKRRVPKQPPNTKGEVVQPSPKRKQP